MHNYPAAIALTLAFMLAGCGGGGSERQGASEPPPADITMARTTDAQGEPHLLSLQLPTPALQAAIGQNQHFVVITTSAGVGSNPATPLFVVNGDVAIGDWRFGLDFAAPGEAGTILVFKAGGSSVQSLAAQIATWSAPAVFNADPLATQSRLTKIVETAIANAADPALASLYGDVARALTDPGWNGVLVLNPSLPGLPAVVQGHTSGLPQGVQAAGQHFRIEASSIPAASAASSVSALIDYPSAPVPVAGQGVDALASLVYLRALFVDSALTLYQVQVK